MIEPIEDIDAYIERARDQWPAKTICMRGRTEAEALCKKHGLEMLRYAEDVWYMRIPIRREVKHITWSPEGGISPVFEETQDALPYESTPEQELLQAMIPVVEVLTRLIYEHHGAGCCMHITTDDGNISDEDVQHCLKIAYLSDHFHCASLAALLLTIPESMREDAMQVPMEARGD